MIVLDTTQNYLCTINEIHNYISDAMISMLVSCDPGSVGSNRRL